MPDSPRGVGAGAVAQPHTNAGATHSINLLIDDRSVSRRPAVSHPLGTRLPKRGSAGSCSLVTEEHPRPCTRKVGDLQ